MRLKIFLFILVLFFLQSCSSAIKVKSNDTQLTEPKFKMAAGYIYCGLDICGYMQTIRLE